jgi:hypothetical protein
MSSVGVPRVVLSSATVAGRIVSAGDSYPGPGAGIQHSIASSDSALSPDCVILLMPQAKLSLLVTPTQGLHQARTLVMEYRAELGAPIGL